MIDEYGHVVGIDNDQCFPDDEDYAGDVNIFAYDLNISAGQQFQRGVLLPEVITIEQKERWLSYDGNLLSKKMPFATKGQKKSAFSRLKQIKAHIRQLPPDRIVSKNQLTTPQVKNWLSTQRKFETCDGREGQGRTSYYGRYL
jgi:hypothetical protein